MPAARRTAAVSRRRAAEQPSGGCQHVSQGCRGSPPEGVNTCPRAAEQPPGGCQHVSQGCRAALRRVSTRVPGLPSSLLSLKLGQRNRDFTLDGTFSGCYAVAMPSNTPSETEVRASFEKMEPKLRDMSPQQSGGSEPQRTRVGHGGDGHRQARQRKSVAATIRGARRHEGVEHSLPRRLGRGSSGAVVRAAATRGIRRDTVGGPRFA